MVLYMEPLGCKAFQSHHAELQKVAHVTPDCCRPGCCDAGAVCPCLEAHEQVGLINTQGNCKYKSYEGTYNPILVTKYP